MNMRRCFGIPFLVLILALGSALSGCGPTRQDIETTYGRMRGQSVNGTGAFAELARGRGHGVIAARRLNEDLEKGIDVIVRFAPNPGPPDRDEAKWYDTWLQTNPTRRLIYVPRDFDAEGEYWKDVLAHLPKEYDKKDRALMELRARLSADWSRGLPPPSNTPADRKIWFNVEKRKKITIYKELEGEWAEGISAGDARLPAHQTLELSGEYPLLSSAEDGGVLAMDWDVPSGARVLAIANGSFLLNEPLARSARRPLAMKTLDWLGTDKRRIAFVEGGNVLADAPEPPSAYRLLFVDPIGWVSAHVVALLLIGCLSRAAILGRPRPDPPSGVDRPSAHPEALGVLLAKTRDVAVAREQLDVYRRRRRPSAVVARKRSRQS